MSKDNLDGLNLSVPDQLYVQTKDRVPFNVNNPPLAFATQLGTDKAFQKRKETVDNWSGNTYRYVDKVDADGNKVMRKDYPTLVEQVREDHPMTDGHILDNVPQSGFTFEKSVSRWTTSNKWFAINDPRGFQLQIAADNLGDILINAGVIGGELQGEFVWAKNGGNIFLCRANHSAYQAKLNPVVTRTALIPGDIVLMGQDPEEYEYLGSYYTTRFGVEIVYFEIATGKRMPYGTQLTSDQRYGSYGWGSPSRRGGTHNDRYEVFSTVDRKPVVVFKSKYGLKVMRQKPKTTKIVRTGNPSFTLQIGLPYHINSNIEASNVALFWDSVEELEAGSPSFTVDALQTVRTATKLNENQYVYYAIDGKYTIINGGDYEEYRNAGNRF